MGHVKTYGFKFRVKKSQGSCCSSTIVGSEMLDKIATFLDKKISRKPEFSRVAYFYFFILFCTFIALNLCQADSKHSTKIQFKNHLSIAIAKSSTTEIAERVHAKLGMPFSRDTILSFSLNRRVLGQNGPHQANHSKPWEHQKQSSGQSVLGIYVQMDRIEELPRTFYLGGCILYYI